MNLYHKGYIIIVGNLFMTESNKMETTILIIEDDEGHALLIKESLKKSGITNTIIHLTDGSYAFSYLTENLKNTGKSPEKKYLILLDIKMSKMNGIEFLKKLKSDINLKTIPVIMLTTTDDPLEIHSCYKLGCNAYVVKPIDFNDFTETLKRIGFFLMIMKITSVNQN